MRSAPQIFSPFKTLLISTAAVVGLAGTAQAQVLELKGLMDNKDFGGSTGFYMPFGSVVDGMLFGSVRGGLLGGQKNGEILGGYGQGFGNVGIRGYAGVGLQEGKNNNLFTAAKAGAELYIGGLGLHVSGSVPFGKTKQISNKGHSDLLLVNPSGQSCDPTGVCTPLPPSCTNPLPGQVKHCDIAIAVTEASHEKALKGFEVGLDYQIQIGNIFITPSVGYYRYGNNEVTGFQSGLDVSIPLTSQLSLNVSAGGNKKLKGNDDKSISGYGSIGISYNFGGLATSQSSALAHRFSQAPSSGKRNVTTAVQKGKTTLYQNNSGNRLLGGVPRIGIIWDQNVRYHAVSAVYVIDATTASQLDDVVAMAPEDAIVIVDGNKGDIQLDDAVVFKTNGVGVLGGGSKGLTFFITASDGRIIGSENVDVPGTRPMIVADDLKRNAFMADSVYNPILYGIDIQAIKYGTFFSNVQQARIQRVTSKEAEYGFFFDKSDSTFLYDVSASGGRVGFRFENSNWVYLLKTSSVDNVDGFLFVQSDNAMVFDASASGGSGNGLSLLSSNNAQINNLSVSEGYKGLYIFNSNNSQVNQFFSKDTEAGIGVVRSDHTILNDIHLENISNTGMYFQESSNFTVNKAEILNSTQGIDMKDSNHGMIQDVAIHNAHITGAKIWDSDYISLNRLSIDGTGASPTHVGLEITADLEMQIANVAISRAVNGYVIQGNDFNTSIKDLGGNTAAYVSRVCDSISSVTSGIMVNKGVYNCK